MALAKTTPLFTAQLVHIDGRKGEAEARIHLTEKKSSSSTKKQTNAQSSAFRKTLKTRIIKFTAPRPHNPESNEPCRKISSKITLTRTRIKSRVLQPHAGA